MTRYDLAGNVIPEEPTNAQQGQMPYAQPGPGTRPQPGNAWPPTPTNSGGNG